MKIKNSRGDTIVDCSDECAWFIVVTFVIGQCLSLLMVFNFLTPEPQVDTSVNRFGYVINSCNQSNSEVRAKCMEVAREYLSKFPVNDPVIEDPNVRIE